MWTFTVYGYLPRTPNSRARQHWSRTTDERNFWEAMVGMNAYLLSIPPATTKRWVEYEIHKPGKIKLRDEDNLNASIKHLQDALVNMKLLVDDSPEWLDYRGVKEYNGKKGYATIVRIGYE